MWEASDSFKVAVLDAQNGVIEAWTPGIATITITSGGTTASAQVTVTATLASLKQLLARAYATGGIREQGVYNSLLVKLNEAEAGAPGTVRAFINELRAQRGLMVRRSGRRA